MEALLTLAFAGWLGKKTVEAVVGGGNKKKRRRSKTNWDRLSYSQKAWLHDHSLSFNGKSCSLNCKIIIYKVQRSWFERIRSFLFVSH